ncbi:permease [Pseudodesulfovibrio piezophilus]|uniref:Permease-like n=1 Tax=Pseudodesulfovibrio piezophilus (strain DSM 21447 / JCM 15486 / C1TLV30) TaxID=1322246 RepID=M1WLT0_PSEP2|nr:permease [Pseudodesulfovibrio piezophilus]CCH48395.1 Permease-like [Pseudodesulfovibrio piezophilus C1TLV30]
MKDVKTPSNKTNEAEQNVEPEIAIKGSGIMLQLALGGIAVAVWYGIYSQLLPFANWFAYSLLGLSPQSHLGSAIQFFVYDTPKVLMLLLLVVFFVGIVRSFVTVDWTRRILAGKKKSIGNILAALLGVVTPFCSCSAVPLFIGFMTAGVPLGVTFSFLISAPMVNEIALVLLYGLLGWKVAALYFVTGISVAIVAGWVMGRMKLEAHVEDWVMAIRAGESGLDDQQMTWKQRFHSALDSVRDIVGRVWKFVVIGIAVGAGIHGYVPEGYLAGIMGDSTWWSVPLSVVIGIPMYTNAAGVIPVVEALLGKGAALGTVLAFMMSVIALSFPEMVILRKVLKPRLIAIFIGVVGCGILFVGYLFNAII